MSFLAIDVGNTRPSGRCEAPRPGAGPAGAGRRVSGPHRSPVRNRLAHLAPTRMLGCVVAGDAVRRRVEDQMELWAWTRNGSCPRCRSRGHQRLRPSPSRLGCDRWVAMIGARQRMLARGPARPLVVVMVGTAVTVEAIDAQGAFWWLILPGHGIMLRALESGTAGLHVPTGEVRSFPTRCSHQRRHLCCRCRRAHLPAPAAAALPRGMMTGGAGWKMAPA